MTIFQSRFRLSGALLVAFAAGVCAEEARPTTPAGAGRLGGGGAGAGLAVRGPQRSPEERALALQKALDLTKEQTAKVQKILQESQQDNREELKALAQDESLSPEEKRAEMRKFLGATAQEIGDVLSPEQQVKWKAILKKRMEQVPSRLDAKPNATGGAEKK